MFALKFGSTLLGTYSCKSSIELWWVRTTHVLLRNRSVKHFGCGAKISQFAWKFKYFSAGCEAPLLIISEKTQSTRVRIGISLAPINKQITISIQSKQHEAKIDQSSSWVCCHLRHPQPLTRPLHSLLSLSNECCCAWYLSARRRRAVVVFPETFLIFSTQTAILPDPRPRQLKRKLNFCLRYL